MRKHIAHYVKNLPNATDLRQKVNVIEDREVLEKTLKEFYKLLYYTSLEI